MKIVLSSGHGKYVSGAVGPAPWGLNEHQEAVRVVNAAAEFLRQMNVDVITYEDTQSRTQNENLKRIVDFHNAQGPHDLDVSVHFNCNVATTAPVGTECWYYSQQQLALDVAAAVAAGGGLKNRSAKKSTGLYFLKYTHEPAILAEICFVDSRADCALYGANFTAICNQLAEALSGGEAPSPSPTPPPGALFHASGTCSWFGGPEDDGVSESEGLAFIYNVGDAPHLFLSQQPSNTTGLARRLDPGVFYVACRWDYQKTSKDMLRDQTRKAIVRAKGKEFLAYPADWGPHEDTHRVADLSPALMEALGLTTDDVVEISYPA